MLKTRLLKKLFFWFFLILSLFPATIFPFYSAHYQEIHHLPRIDSGNIDLSDINFHTTSSIPLNGCWIFYENYWKYTEPVSNVPIGKPVMVPTMWNTSGKGENFKPRYGYGSYVLNIENYPQDDDWIIYIPHADAAYRVYLNGTLVSSSGSISKEDDKVVINNDTIKNILTLPKDEHVEVVIEASTKYSPVLNGTPVLIRAQKDLISSNIRYSISSIYLGIYLAYLTLCIFLIFSGDKEMAPFPLFLLCISVQSFILSNGEVGSTVQMFLPFISSLKFHGMANFLSNFIPILLLICTQEILKIEHSKKEQLLWFLLTGISISGQYLLIDTVLGNYTVLFKALGIIPAFAAVITAFQAINSTGRYALSLCLAWISLLSGFLTAILEFLGLYVFHLSIYLPTCYTFSITVLFSIYVRKNRENQRIQRQIQEKELEYSRLQIKVKESENLIMLSQIRPHFIYNALIAIYNLNQENSVKAGTAILQFARYMRGNMQLIGKEEAIPFSKELEHIKNYVAIEQLRFDERLHVIYDIQFDQFYLPPLCVQPLVENAIKHGICKRLEGGTVSLQTYCDETWIYIVVEDDGVGFQTDILQRSETESLGIRNITRRLELYGNSQVQIHSIPGKGTTVTILLKKGASEK